MNGNGRSGPLVGARDPFARPAWLRYGIGVVCVGLAWAVREALTKVFGNSALPFLTFYPAVAVAVWYGGLAPGVLSIVLSALLSRRFFFQPAEAFELQNAVALAAFAVTNGFIAAAIESMHRARRRLVIDICERREAEADLRDSHDLLSTTLASIGDGVIVTDSSGSVTMVNATAEQLTGWNSADAIGRPLPSIFRIVNEITREVVENPVEKVLRLGGVVGLANHTVLIAKDGSERPIDDSAAPIQRPGGALRGVVLVFRDFTARRKAALEHGRLAAIVESSGDAIVSKNLDGVIQTWNDGAQRLFGYRSDEIIGKPVTVLIPPERLDEETTILERLRRGQPSVLIETVRVAKGGRRIPVSVNVSPILDREGRVVGASKILRDLTAIVAALEALAREKELLATTLSSIGDAVIATDAKGIVTFMNPIAETLTGWTGRDAAGRPLLEVFRIVNEQTRKEVENPATRSARDGVIVGLANHTVLISRTGEERPIDDSAAPIRNGGDKIAGSVLVFRDITQRRQIESDLRTSRDRLRVQADELLVADRRKNEFLATLAHELRNPMAAITNSVSVLQMKGPPDPDLAMARDVIDRQVQHMTRLLDDLLDVSRLGSHKLDLQKQRVTLSTIVESAVETARPSITLGKHELSTRLPPAEVVLHADPVRLAQVFSNLLNNAAKYMEPGGRITLDAKREGGNVVVSVRDAGVGIAPESMKQIFQMFSQLPSSLERSQGGVGVGLWLAKNLVELHGGSITAHSAGAGKGSEFVVVLPVATSAGSSPTRRATRPTSSVKRRILVADDHKDTAETLAVMLRSLGHDVKVVYDGADALKAAAELRPAVVLLDVGMPRLSGYDVCRRIRAEPWGRSMLLVAQTGWGQEMDRRRAEEAGFDRHLLKPVDFSALVGVLDELQKVRGG
jgi:PAS domain S-box-containing protein